MRSLLGDGAMGRVYEAWDPLLSRVVAVKSLKREHLDPRTGAEYLRRFGREAQAAGALSHPSIVKVFDVGPDYLVMELVHGPTLKDLLGRQGCLEPEQVVRILQPIAEALDYAHAAGVVHRDVKPANIILQPDGTPKLMDFGVAWVASSIVTGQGEVVGSPCYMSPEQIVGEDVGGTADVYALGVVAYEMLTGLPPFVGTVTQVIYRVVHGTPPLVRERNPALPVRYDEVFARALDKQPERRYPTAAELVAALSPRRSGERRGAVTQPIKAPIPSSAPVETVALPSRAGWHASVETVAWERLAAAGRRASSHRPALGFLTLLCLGAAAVALLGQASDLSAPPPQEPARLAFAPAAAPLASPPPLDAPTRARPVAEPPKAAAGTAPHAQAAVNPSQQTLQPRPTSATASRALARLPPKITVTAIAVAPSPPSAVPPGAWPARRARPRRGAAGPGLGPDDAAAPQRKRAARPHGGDQHGDRRERHSERPAGRGVGRRGARPCRARDGSRLALRAGTKQRSGGARALGGPPEAIARRRPLLRAPHSGAAAGAGPGDFAARR